MGSRSNKPDQGRESGIRPIQQPRSLLSHILTLRFFLITSPIKVLEETRWWPGATIAGAYGSQILQRLSLMVIIPKVQDQVQGAIHGHLKIPFTLQPGFPQLKRSLWEPQLRSSSQESFLFASRTTAFTLLVNGAILTPPPLISLIPSP